MLMRRITARAARGPFTFAPHTTLPLRCLQARQLTDASGVARIPKPIPFVPDVPTFLKLIGRQLSQHSEKISSWDDLFSLTSEQIKDLGIEPARSRRYLLHWIDKYRHGEFGLGGDARFVGKDGSIELRLVELELSPQEAKRRGISTAKASLTTTENTVRRVLNVPSTARDEAEESTAAGAAPADEAEAKAQEAGEEQAADTVAPEAIPASRLPELSQTELSQAGPIQGISYRPGRGIKGSHIQVVKGTHGLVALLPAKEGLWEHRRGQKVDGGERRKAEVRSKRRAADRRAGRA